MSPGWKHSTCKTCGWEWHTHDGPMPRGFVCGTCEHESDEIRRAEARRLFSPIYGTTPTVISGEPDPVTSTLVEGPDDEGRAEAGRGVGEDAQAAV